MKVLSIQLPKNKYCTSKKKEKEKEKKERSLHSGEKRKDRMKLSLLPKLMKKLVWVPVLFPFVRKKKERQDENSVYYQN
jgi:hypothetical protein